MLREVKFGCTALMGTGKQGVLTADSDGYFELPIGGLDVFNSAGEFYPYQEAKSLFEQSSSLMRRVNTACLKGEYGHPKRQPGQSYDEYAARILQIHEQMICVHYAEIWLDFNSVKGPNGKPIVAIMARLKPSGPYGDALSKSLGNKNEDVCFSIRSFTNDVRVRGVNNRQLVEVVTWDYVNEPGISIARKFKSPGLESFTDTEASFTKEHIQKAVEPIEGMAMESAQIAAQAIFQAFGWDSSALTTPKFLDWS